MVSQIPADGVGMFTWLESYVTHELGDLATRLTFNLEPTVSGSHSGRIEQAAEAESGRRGRPLIKADVLADRIRLHFPIAWSERLAAWLGEPPAPDYYLKSNWVHDPSIGVLATTPEAYAGLATQIVALLRMELETA